MMLQKILNQDLILVVDDFYRELDWIGTHLQTKEFSFPENNNYAGQFSSPPEESLIAQKKINLLLGKNFIFGPADGEIRSTQATDSGLQKTLVHTDEFSLITVLIYLSDPPKDQNAGDFGTRFYEHKALRTRKLLSELPAKLNIQKEIILRDSNNLESWINWETIPFKKNRAVIFNSRLFHSPPLASYGDSLESSRLTQHFFPNLKILP